MTINLADWFSGLELDLLEYVAQDRGTTIQRMVEEALVDLLERHRPR